MTSEQAQWLIKTECDRICNLLLSKNKRYGNSAMEPKRVFSRATSIEQLLVRIDDKLSRIANTGWNPTEQDDGELPADDLIGYLILLNCRQTWDRMPVVPTDPSADAALKEIKEAKETDGVMSTKSAIQVLERLRAYRPIKASKVLEKVDKMERERSCKVLARLSRITQEKAASGKKAGFKGVL